MAHFALIDENNIVQNVIVVGNLDILDENGEESEEVGQAFIASIGIEGNWIQTSYNSSFRSKYAQPGDIYDSENDIFISPSE